jgi:hypothetical protein
MILPNKFTTFKESTLSRLPLLLETISDQIHIDDLYDTTQNHFEDVSEFICKRQFNTVLTPECRYGMSYSASAIAALKCHGKNSSTRLIG